MLKLGDSLPEFIGTNQNGEPIDSQNLKGKKLVVFFYPKASTPGCTVEACNLRDNYSVLKQKSSYSKNKCSLSKCSNNRIAKSSLSVILIDTE